MIDMTPEVFACEAPAKGAGAARAAAMAALVPQIETARLTLRAPRAEDFPLYAEILCSDRGRYMGGPFTRDEAWSDFTRIVAAWLLRGHGAWTVEVTEAGRIAGFVLLGFVDDTVTDVADALAEEVEYEIEFQVGRECSAW